MYDDGAEHTTGEVKRIADALGWRVSLASHVSGLDRALFGKLEPTVSALLHNMLDHLAERTRDPGLNRTLLKRHVQDGPARVSDGRLTQALESWSAVTRLLRSVMGVAAARGEVVGEVEAALLFSEPTPQSESKARLGYRDGQQSAPVLGVALVGEQGLAIASVRELIEGSRDRAEHPAHDPQRLAGFVAALGAEEVPETLIGEIVALLRAERRPEPARIAVAVKEADVLKQPVGAGALEEQGFPRCLAIAEMKIPPAGRGAVKPRVLGDDPALAEALARLGLDTIIQATPIAYSSEAEEVIDPDAVAEWLVHHHRMRDPVVTVVARSEVKNINTMSRLIPAHGVSLRPTAVQCWHARERTGPSTVAFAGRLKRRSTTHHLFRVSPRLLDDVASRARLFGVIELLMQEGPTGRLVGSQLRLLQPLRTGGRPPQSHRVLVQAMATAHALLLASRHETEDVAA
jgi:hypothetical protein